MLQTILSFLVNLAWLNLSVVEPFLIHTYVRWYHFGCKYCTSSSEIVCCEYKSKVKQIFNRCKSSRSLWFITVQCNGYMGINWPNVLLVRRRRRDHPRAGIMSFIQCYPKFPSPTNNAFIHSAWLSIQIQAIRSGTYSIPVPLDFLQDRSYIYSLEYLFKTRISFSL
jgi:hypothetical protein